MERHDVDDDDADTDDEDDQCDQIWQNFKVFDNFLRVCLGSDKIMNQVWQIFVCFRTHIFIVGNGKILKSNLAIRSH